MSNIDIFKGKRWLFYGSIIGGALGAVLIHLNQYLPAETQLSFDMPAGFASAVVIGMVGGLIGGAIGSFIAGAVVGEDMFFNIGVSLGIGLTNGFLAGSAIGLIIGSIQRWATHLATPMTLLWIALAVILFAAVVHLITRKR